MANASDIAQYLLFAAANNEDEAQFLTNMHLQKLLYYVQGWSMAARDQPAFKERIEAWVYGPVVPNVFREHRSCGKAIIPPPDEAPVTLADDERELADAVWETYKDHSAISLSKMTHSEPPWNEARRGIPPEQPCHNQITPDSLRRYFSPLLSSDSD